VDCLDENIGKVVAALDKKGLRANTLILFHSDNGGTTDKRFTGQMADVSKLTLPCDNGPYRSGKGALFEGGCRVAACANWPGRIKPQTVNAVIHAVDIYPTLAALAGASTAKCKPLDGVNVYGQRGSETEWKLLGRDNRPPYDDVRPLGTPGVPEERRYRVIGVVDDTEVTPESDTVTITLGT